MPSPTPSRAPSLQWTLLAVLLLAGIVLALALGPETTPIVTLQGGTS